MYAGTLYVLCGLTYFSGLMLFGDIITRIERRHNELQQSLTMIETKLGAIET